MAIQSYIQLYTVYTQKYIELYHTIYIAKSTIQFILYSAFLLYQDQYSVYTF